MATAKRPGWRRRLAAYLAAAAARPFEPGVHDCALFVAGAVAAMTGEDHAALWRDRYSTIQGGLKALRAEGFADHVALVAERLDEIAPAYAQVGDIAVVDGDDAIAALGIVQGEMIYVLRPSGIGLLPLTAARRAFRL